MRKDNLFWRISDSVRNPHLFQHLLLPVNLPFFTFYTPGVALLKATFLLNNMDLSKAFNCLWCLVEEIVVHYNLNFEFWILNFIGRKTMSYPKGRPATCAAPALALQHWHSYDTPMYLIQPKRMGLVNRLAPPTTPQRRPLPAPASRADGFRKAGRIREEVSFRSEGWSLIVKIREAAKM